MKDASMVLQRVLRRITPTENDRKKTEKVLAGIRRATKEVTENAGLIYTLAGSYLRDTWLKDKKEFDIFILFPETVQRAELEKKGLSLAKEIVERLEGTYEIAYAEHPYVRAKIGGYDVDFVPCYDIKNPEKIKSAVDRTPHHNKYILQNLTPELSSEVRLLKIFLKAAGIYGSDLRVEGFSGYLSELLIIRYRSFLNLLKDASTWEAGKVFIDLRKHHKTVPDLKKIYPGQPLVVIDPVDSKRNVAAALSPANFEKFKEAAREFLKDPDEKYFRVKKMQVSTKALSSLMEKRGTECLGIFFKRPDVVDDVIYPQLRRTSRRLKGVLEDADFKVLGHDVWCDVKRCLIFMELEVWKLPKIKKLAGPPTFSKKHSDEFTKKYRGKGRIWVEGANLVAEIKREYIDAGALLRDMLKHDIKTLRANGISSHPAESIASGFSIAKGPGVVREAAKNENLASFLGDYFKSRIL